MTISLLGRVRSRLVIRSSAEAEYRATTHTLCELMWIKHLLEELRLVVKLPMDMYCNNQAAIDIASNLVFHERTKHIEVNCHLVMIRSRRVSLLLRLFSLEHKSTRCSLNRCANRG